MKALPPAFASIAAGIVALATAASLHAVPMVITFDEVQWGPPFLPIDGASAFGITLDYKIGGVDSPEARIATGPGLTTYVDAPLIEGNAEGVLTIDFDVATPVLDFGVAILGPEADPGFSVELFDSSLSSLGVTGVPVVSMGSVPEGLFSYTGIGVSRAVVSFDPNATRFALDNILFDPMGDSSPVPDGGTTVLLTGIALFGVGGMKRLMRR